MTVVPLRFFELQSSEEHRQCQEAGGRADACVNMPSLFLRNPFALGSENVSKYHTKTSRIGQSGSATA